MSVESAQAFVTKCSKDPAFISQITKAPTAEAKQAIVKQAGFNFTKADLKAVNQQNLEKLPDDVALPQSSGTWVGVGAGVVGTGAGIAAVAVAATSSAAAAAI